MPPTISANTDMFDEFLPHAGAGVSGESTDVSFSGDGDQYRHQEGYIIVAPNTF